MDEGIDEMLDGAEWLPGSSQESLTKAAANLNVDVTSQSTAPTSVQSEQEDDVKHEGASCEDPDVRALSDSAPEHTLARLTVTEKIERIFQSVSDALTSKGGQLCVTLSTAATSPHSQGRARRICFPGKTAEEAWRFTVVMRIMELMHDAIRRDVVLSKRDVYYRDPALFGSQAVVNRYVDSIAYTFDVPRAMLNVTAAAKGLVAGAFTICRRDGSIVDARSEKEGLLVPALRDVLSIDVSAVKWILVIEKEASFRSIAASSFWDDVSTHGVMMTGKGYPDIATRALLHYMSTASPRNGFASPPVYCLVDFDPDGLAIMQTYKNGSATMAHENEDLCVPQMQWLGLRSEHLAAEADDVHSDQGRLELTTRDRRKSISMLERSASRADDQQELEARSALQTMVMLNMKAELQLLDANPRGMVDMLTSALIGPDW